MSTEKTKTAAGYTDGLNDLMPPEVLKEVDDFERGIALLTLKQFEDILRRVAPGNPFAERLLAAGRSVIDE